LLVEDDVPTLRLERVILEEAGYKVRVLGSGEEALQSLAIETPALVMLDIGLPGMDGFTTCERIRESSQVPVLMVSGLDGADAKARGRSVGATDYVTKPFATHELAGLVNKLILSSNTNAWAGPYSDPPGPTGGLSRNSVGYASGHAPTLPSQSLEPEPEGEPVALEEPAGTDNLREPNGGIYEGTVRLTVTTPGAVSRLLAFVGELRQNPGFRLLRLVANQSREGMDIWLGLRKPLSLKAVLLEMKGVSQVTTPTEPAANDSEPVLIVLLGQA